MLVNALLLSRDKGLLALLRRGSDELGIRPHECPNVGVAGTQLSTKRFEGIILDIDDMEGASGLLEAVRKMPSNKSSIVVAVTNNKTTIRDAFQHGANLVLEKPVTADKLQRSLRAAHSMMMRERRRALRLPVDFSVMIRNANSTEERVSATDLSEGGIGVESTTQLKIDSAVRVRFLLPETDTWIECAAQVKNSTRDGHAGLAFVNLGGDPRNELTQWLATRIEQQAGLAMHRPPTSTGPQSLNMGAAAGR